MNDKMLLINQQFLFVQGMRDDIIKIKLKLLVNE